MRGSIRKTFGVCGHLFLLGFFCFDLLLTGYVNFVSMCSLLKAVACIGARGDSLAEKRRSVSCEIRGVG